MSAPYSLIHWFLLLALLTLNVGLLLCKKEKAAFLTSNLMIGYGAFALIMGLLFYFSLGIIGVIILLLGVVLHLTTKDLIQSR